MMIENKLMPVQFGQGQGWAAVAETKGEVSDGYHTFDELYNHRHVLFIALMASHPERSWFSRKHADGTAIEGWFIAGMTLPNGPITYHLPERLYTWCRHLYLKELDNAPEWDGHESLDVIDRLHHFAGLIAAAISAMVSGMIMLVKVA